MIIPSENSTYKVNGGGNGGLSVIENSKEANFWQGAYNSGDKL